LRWVDEGGGASIVGNTLIADLDPPSVRFIHVLLDLLANAGRRQPASSAANIGSITFLLFVVL